MYVRYDLRRMQMKTGDVKLTAITDGTAKETMRRADVSLI